MKRIIAILAAATAVLSLGSCCNSGQNQLRVISYNIRNSRANDKGDNNWEIRKPATTAMLKEINPDIFGVQEAYIDQIEYISENCPEYANVGVGRDDGKAKGEHMSIFYNKEIIELLDWGTYWLSETPDVPSKGWDADCIRTATWTKLKIIATGKEFFYVNTHLDHIGPEAQKNGLALIVKRIGEMNPKGKLPMILTGDFNVTPDSPSLTELDKIMKSARTYAKDSDDAGSFNGWGNYSDVIDYIYYSGFSTCTNFKVLNQKFYDKGYISDHYPVMADLKF